MQPDKAFNIIGDLVSRDGRTFKKGLANYHKIMKKHETIEPLPVRLAITREATIVRQKKAKEIIVKQKQSKAVGSIAKRFREYQSWKQAFLVDVIMYRIPDEDEVTKNKKMWKGYIPVYGGIKQFRIMATAGFMKDNVRIEKRKMEPHLKKLSSC